MFQVQVYKRLTSKWAPGWSHLEEQEYLGTVKLTPSRYISMGNGYDVGATSVNYGRLKAGSDRKKMMRALEQSLSGSCCQHDYDCCGCPTTYATVTPYGTRDVKVVIRTTYNY